LISPFSANAFFLAVMRAISSFSWASIAWISLIIFLWKSSFIISAVAWRCLKFYLFSSKVSFVCSFLFINIILIIIINIFKKLEHFSSFSCLLDFSYDKLSCWSLKVDWKNSLLIHLWKEGASDDKEWLPVQTDPKLVIFYRSPCSSCSLQIVNSAEWEIIIYNSFQIRNIKSSGSEISAKKEIVLAVSEKLIIL